MPKPCTKWGQAIRDRDKVCQIGKALYDISPALMLFKRTACQGNLEAHHLVGRGNKHLKDNPDNGILLCAFHHKHCKKFAPHMSRKGFEGFLEAHMPLKWKFLKKHKNEIQKGSEFKEIHEADKQGVEYGLNQAQ